MKCCTKFWMNFLRLCTSIQHQPSNIHGIHSFLYSYVQILTNNRKLKKNAEQSVMFLVLSESVDSDDKNLTRGKPDCG